MKTALYARYSTDRQSDSSIDDQFRVTRELVAREGWTEVAAHCDREISGAVTDRPGYQALLTEVRAGRIQIIVVEEVSRLWRAQGEQWRCVEELEYLGVHIIGVRDGIDTRRAGYELLLAVRGAQNANARRETAWRTHRGLTGKIERGLSAGGVPYGYTTIEVEGGRALEIVEAQADIVREVFARFAAGESARAITYDLNERRIPSKRGGTWSQSALYGNPAYGTGLLANELYIGRLIWNRSRWIHQPGTKKRTRIERPRAEWIIQELPDLQIIEDDLWHAAQARRSGPRLAGGIHGKGGKPTTLLAGILRCGACGGPITAINQSRYGCSTRHNRGPVACGQDKSLHRGRADAEILALIRERMEAPEQVEVLKDLVREELKAAQAPAQAAVQRLQEIDREIRNLTDALARMGWSDALQRRLQQAEAERAQHQVPTQPAPVVPDMIPRLLDRYREALDALPAIAREHPEQARQTVRDLVGEITVTEENGDLWAEMNDPSEGVVQVLLGKSTSMRMVAGARFASHRRIRFRVRAA